MHSGYVFVCRVNSHRDKWNGTICKDAANWDCGTGQPTFRADFCQIGIERCFHMHLFDAADPHFVIPDRTVVQFCQEQPGFLVNQVILFAGSQSKEPAGITMRPSRDVVHGVYWVKSAELERRANVDVVVVRPHKEAWALFPANRVEKPFDQRFGDLMYLKYIPDDSVFDFFQRALEDARAANWDATPTKRLAKFAEALPGRIDQARAAIAPLLVAKTTESRVSYSPASPRAPSPFAALGALKLAAPPTRESPTRAGVTPAQPQPTAPSPTALPAVAPAEVAAVGHAAAKAEEPEKAPGTQPYRPVYLPEGDCRSRIEAEYGRRVLSALEIASRSKSLTILTGNPGVGKSRLAALMLEDPDRERSIIVPVASTWRGREDLFGYVNPVTGEFEPTGFTKFLVGAEEAWDRHDRRPRLIIFEEFNISQPEHWLSDILVRCEYPSGARADRTVELGGRGISGMAGRPSTVFLTPNTSFLATINNDHTVRALSPRVIDRSAVIEVTSTVREAMIRVELSVEPGIERVIEELNSLLETKGVAFSVRTARSLKRCEEHLGDLGLTFAQLVDVVLANELLAKVRLMAGDPRDEQLLDRLATWIAREDCRPLAQCAERIENWADLLRSGRDVFQA